jgi:hypothetical protein
MVPIPEGQVIVRCPYCELRSVVRGERGYQRYQVPCRVDRGQAEVALGGFFSRHRAIAGDVKRRATLEEVFLAHVPFWISQGRVLGWVFGQKEVGSGDRRRLEPREVQISQEATWNGAACDVGEFGIESVPLEGLPLEPFDPLALHAHGMVFEPVGSVSEARAEAEEDFSERVRASARLDRVSQIFMRTLRPRFGLVYYPLWVLRYHYRGRSFQVLVDGYAGKVLYGKAPGNTLYRAAVLVGGMALGALLAVDGAAAAAGLGVQLGDDGEFLFAVALIALVAGAGLMAAAYRAFRHGEQFEYRTHAGKPAPGLFEPQALFSQMKEFDQWIDQLS